MNFSILRSAGSLLVLIALLSACANEDEMVTESGLTVQVLRKGNDTAPIKGGVALLNLRFVTEDGRLLFDSDKRGGAIPIMTTDQDKGLLDEVVDILKVGDSVYFEIPAEDLFEKTYNQNLPDSIERGTKLLFNLGFANTYTATAYEMLLEKQQATEVTKWQAEGMKQHEIDVAAIDKRLKENGEACIKLESGVRIVMRKKGAGGKPSAGDQLYVLYEGRYFTNGEIFDATDESEEPLEFTLGSEVITGWNIAFAELPEGTKATLYIPSGLAYGQVGTDTIPPNSILIFDVDFIKLEKNKKYDEG